MKEPVALCTVLHSRSVLAARLGRMRYAVAMAVYLFTFHTYRSWMSDHRRGYVRRGSGIVAPSRGAAAAYARRARFQRVMLRDQECRVAVDAIARVCDHPARADWHLHIAVAVFNHIHALVSWRHFAEVKHAQATLHRAITVDLRDALGLPPGRPVLSRGGSHKRILTRPHFRHLLHTYLPAHAKFGGAIRWGTIKRTR